jgi:DNA-binding GntR family transcriptional regulator
LSYSSRAVEFAPPRGPQLSSNVASYIRDLIMSGEVQGGEFLRVDRIAQDMQVSVTPVREALAALRGEGFVAQEPHRGFVVLPLSAQDVEDLFHQQARIAGELAARAIAAVDETMIAGLERLQDELEAAAAANMVDEVERLNFQFHRIINTSSGPTKLVWVLSLLVRYAPRRFFANIPGWAQASVAEHRLIIDQLRRRDEAQVRQSMEAHIVHAGSLLAEHLARRMEG